MFVLFLVFIRQAKASLMSGVASLLDDIGNSLSSWKAKVLLLSALNNCYFVHQGLKCFLSVKKLNMPCMDLKISTNVLKGVTSMK
jgi:hypothetical protein